MSISIHTDATVGPDGTLDLHVPDLPPGQHVAITIDVPDEARSTPGTAGEPAGGPPHLTALELMQLPLEERHRLLAQSVPEAAEAFRSDPELMAFSALDAEDWEDAGE